MGLPNILQAVQLLKKYPDYHFVLDQVAYVRPFLERYPEEEPAFRKAIAEGRLQLVLGMDVMPDVNTPGGETFVRQIQYGKGYYREKLGVDVTVAWLVDTFGHHGQMPQILKLGGYKSFWFSRGVPRHDFPSEFFWEGIDSTQIAAYWLPYSYGLFYGSPGNLTQFNGFAKQRFDMLGGQSKEKDRVAASGVDVSEPEPHLPVMIEQYNKQADAPLALRLAVPTDFEAVVDKRPTARPVFRGEMNPIFQGTYSSRADLKQWMRTSQQLLTAAEKFSCLATVTGSIAPPANAVLANDGNLLWRAWEPVLFSETHDCASGVMTDHVYQDTIRSYEFSKRLADGMIAQKTDAITARINTSGDGGIPIVVFNTLGWARSDTAEALIGFTDDGITDIGLLDSAGKEVAGQILESLRYSEGGLKQAKIAFVARDVPAMGYSVFRATGKKSPPVPAPAPPAPDSIENEFYRIKFDLGTGEMKSLILKAAKDGPPADWEAIAGGGNVVCRQPDHGDLWELYHGLNGGSNIAMTTVEAVPKAPESKLSSESKGADLGALRAGPVFSEFSVFHALDTGTFATRVRLYAGVRRVDIRTQLVNKERFVRYQALFPTTIKNGKNVHAIPFGAIERPTGIEFPAQDWVDYGDGQHGLAVLNFGNPGNVQTDGTMMLSLLRSHTLGAYGFQGGYEPGMSSDSGLQLGREMTMQYALSPHTGDWREAGVYRQGLEFNNPLIVRKTAVHDGALPARWGMLDISSPNVVLSSFNPGSGGKTMILRVYEAAGIATPGAKVSLHVPLASAGEVNLMEDPIRDLAVANDGFSFDLHPYEIKSFSLHLQPMPH